MRAQGRAEPRAKAQRWAGHGGRGSRTGAHCAGMERLREAAGSQTQKGLRYHVGELGLYPPGFGGSIEGV